MRGALALLAIVVLVVACSPAGERAGGQSGGRNAELAERIVDRMAIRQGDRFLALTGDETDRELLGLIEDGVRAAGGEVLGSLAATDEPDPYLLGQVDVSIMMPGSAPGMPVYAAIQDLLRAGQGRNVHFHWLSMGSFMPVVPDGYVPDEDGILATYVPAVLDADYDAITLKQEAFERAMREGEVHVTTPAGTDLRFSIGDRPVCKQNGDASERNMDDATILIDREIELPCGAIRVAPVETTVQGVIAFPPSIWNDTRVEGLKLTLVDGRVTEVTADVGRDAVIAELDAGGDGARTFREFALGFNPLLAIPETDPWIPYYGYGAGVVRLSLGDNSELGGNVTGGYVRWNFFTDATVTINGHTWVESGAFENWDIPL